MSISKQDVITAALQLERDGRKFYLDASNKATSPLARQMFQSLAEDESRHIEWIENIAPGARSAEEVNQDLYKRLSHIFAEMPEETRRGAHMAQHDADAIALAIGIEIKSRDAYAQWARDADSKDVRDLCQVLAGVEDYHKKLLENTREYLNYSGDWFLQDKGVVELG